MRKYSLSTMLFVWLLLSVMTPTLLLSMLYLSSFKQAFLLQEQEHLSQLADNKVKQIEDYINERIADALSLSQSTEIAHMLHQLGPLYRDNGKQSPVYKDLLDIYRNNSLHYKDYGYVDLLLISPDGEVMFSLAMNSDFGTNIGSESDSGSQSESGLEFVVQRAKYFLESSSSTFSFYPPLGQAAAFIGSPILEQGQLIGIVVLAIDSQIIQQVTLDVSGSRASREVVVAALQGGYFSYQAELKYDKNILVGAPQPLETLPESLDKAISGSRHIGVTRDYRGVEVIAASRYIPSVQWGLVFKEDRSEVMLVYDRLLRLGMLILLLILAGVLMISGLLGRKLAKPFESMTGMTSAIAAGDITSSIKPEGYRESYELAQRFNQMSQALLLARDTLEQKVDERTAELTDEIGLRESKEAALAESYEKLNQSMTKLQTMQTQLVESEKMASLGGLVAGFAHELNTPIGVAITASSTLRREVIRLEKSLDEGELTEELFIEAFADIKHVSHLLDKNLQRAASLVSNFKLVAVEQTNLHKESFVLHELVESLLTSLYPETKKFKAEICNDIPVDIVMNSYPGDFYQVLTNLILNALCHAFDEKQEGRVCLNASIESQDLCLTVSDNGKGISEQHIGDIFEPFFTTKRGQGGSGLGLSIVYNIVCQKLNGEIGVDSTVEKGTVFSIRCPLNGQE